LEYGGYNRLKVKTMWQPVADKLNMQNSGSVLGCQLMGFFPEKANLGILLKNVPGIFIPISGP
jgi:hypothetical protein